MENTKKESLINKMAEKSQELIVKTIASTAIKSDKDLTKPTFEVGQDILRNTIMDYFNLFLAHNGREMTQEEAKELLAISDNGLLQVARLLGVKVDNVEKALFQMELTLLLGIFITETHS